MSTLAPALPTTSNRILNALSRAEYERLAPYLEFVEMRLGDVLCQPNEPITHVYFPNRGTVSLVSSFEDGGTVEVGMVGNEGMFGVCVFLGTVSTPLLAQVQLAGDGLRMRTDVLKREFDKGGLLHDMLLRYTQAFITQIALTAACNRAHHISARLSKWLLMCQDRSQSKELGLTHEFIATMLGTRRAGVTEAATQLRDAEIISYSRGHVTILDREMLEAQSCECYPMLKKEFARLVGGNAHALGNENPPV
ncbi:MAG TPA: Crp/Fnr family transcriptional regulator [Pyrinomonadaceae bacterium]|nr:Crp/Fnr family transcriptional regulator [Pyrinomonadaceae bacterium]